MSIRVLAHLDARHDHRSDRRVVEGHEPASLDGAAAEHLPRFPRAIRVAFDAAHVVDGRTLVNGADRFVAFPCGIVWHVVARDGCLSGYMYRHGREVARTS